MCQLYAFDAININDLTRNTSSSPRAAGSANLSDLTKSKISLDEGSEFYSCFETDPEVGAYFTTELEQTMEVAGVGVVGNALINVPGNTMFNVIVNSDDDSTVSP